MTNHEILIRILMQYPPFRDTKPLAIGIHKEIAQRLGFSNKSLRRFLGEWVRRPVYQRALTLYQYRYAIDGEIAGKVTPEQVLDAKEKMGRKGNASISADTRRSPKVEVAIDYKCHRAMTPEEILPAQRLSALQRPKLTLKRS